MLPSTVFAAKEVDMARMGSHQHLSEVPEGRPASADQPSDIENSIRTHPKANPSRDLTPLIDLQAGIAHGTFTISNSGL